MLKNNDNDIAPRKINNDSVIPKIEFCMILGSNTKIAAPIIAIFSSKNSLKLMGLTILSSHQKPGLPSKPTIGRVTSEN